LHTTVLMVIFIEVIIIIAIDGPNMKKFIKSLEREMVELINWNIKMLQYSNQPDIELALLINDVLILDFKEKVVMWTLFQSIQSIKT
jgi:hypothetical protein